MATNRVKVKQGFDLLIFDAKFNLKFEANFDWQGW